MDDNSDDKYNGDGVDDGSININGGDGKRIVKCGDDEGGGGVDTNGGSDPDFGDDKSKCEWRCSGDAAVDDGNSNNDGNPNDGGGIDTNDTDCEGDDADIDGDNNDNAADGDKSAGDGNDANDGSNDEGGGGNDNRCSHTDGIAKDGGSDDGNDKDDIDFWRWWWC